MAIRRNILLISLIISLTCAKLIVYSPEKLKNLIDDSKNPDYLTDGYIETSVANFGLIPYGHSIVGTLYFDTNNQYGCDKFSGLGNSEKQESPIIIV